MQKVKTSELTGAALDWAVAKCEGATTLRHDSVACWWFTLNGRDRVLSGGWSAKQNWQPSTDWSQGGPIIERERFCVMQIDNGWCCTTNGSALHSHAQQGQTPLIAAMRCYVASKMGDTIEIPEELTQ